MKQKHEVRAAPDPATMACVVACSCGKREVIDERKAVSIGPGFIVAWLYEHQHEVMLDEAHEEALLLGEEREASIGGA